MARYHIGVDVGKDRHHVCIRDLSNNTYRSTFSVTNDHDGFAQLVSHPERLSADRDDFLIGVESCPCGLNVSYLLMSSGFSVVEGNTFRAGRFRKAQGRKAKTDRIDARPVADILSLGNHKPLCIPDQILDNLKELTHFRTDLVNEKSAAIIHLREALSILFPEFDEVFRQLDSAGLLALLAAFPGPEHVIAAGEERVGKVLSSASPHRMGRDMARRIIKVAQNTVGVTQKQLALGIKVSILAKRIPNLQSNYSQTFVTLTGKPRPSTTVYRISQKVFPLGELLLWPPSFLRLGISTDFPRSRNSCLTLVGALRVFRPVTTTWSIRR